jgi:hypothetical protein
MARCLRCGAENEWIAGDSRKHPTDRDPGFYAGVLVCLAQIDAHGDTDSPLYREILDAVGYDDLVAVARADGQMRLSGLDKIVRKRRRTPPVGPQRAPTPRAPGGGGSVKESR